MARREPSDPLSNKGLDGRYTKTIEIDRDLHIGKLGIRLRPGKGSEYDVAPEPWLAQAFFLVATANETPDGREFSFFRDRLVPIRRLASVAITPTEKGGCGIDPQVVRASFEAAMEPVEEPQDSGN